MPLERHTDDLTACDGIKFWMSDGERPVLCRVSHEALRDLADRVHFGGTDEKVFEAYRELVEQVASDAYDAGASVEVVVGDQRAEVVGAERDQDGIDELSWPPGAVQWRNRLIRRGLPGPEVGDARGMCREKVAEMPGHAAGVYARATSCMTATAAVA